MNIKKLLKQNAIVRLFSTYVLILVLVGVTCLNGFGRAIDIVEENAIQESSSLLRQGCSDMDYFLKNIYNSGMKLASSQNLKQLGNCSNTSDINYYYQVKTVMQDFDEALNYLDNEIYRESFIYVNSIDRVIFDGGVYRGSLFKEYLANWGIEQQEWDRICEKNNALLNFYITETGELFYLFPCAGRENTIAVVGFHIDQNFLLENMQFLKNYSTYSIFLMQNGEPILGVDKFEQDIDASALEIMNDTVEEQAVRSEHKLILQKRSESIKGKYLLILPENETFTQIEGLKRFLYIPLILAFVFGMGFAIYCAVKTGKPINRIAKKINDIQTDEVPQRVNTDLNYLDATIEQIIERQKADKGALQQSFFHNLLKADFVSRSELEYTAKRADISLTGKEYYAVSVRLFPEIDADHIDGQTVEEARALQIILDRYLQTNALGMIWSYKRNTLTFQYIIEADGVLPEKMRQLISTAAEWLKEVHHVKSCWGISTICQDLMSFWKNAQESQDALKEAGQREPVLFYSELRGLDNSFYLPYSMEEHLAQGLRSGEFDQVGQTLEILQEENLFHRKLDRRQFLKLGRRISDILATQCGKLDETEEYLIRLNGKLIENPAEIRNEELYFEELKQVCYRICGIVAGQKNLKRNNKMKAILQYMEENFSNTGMGLALVSEQFGFSEGYLSALFKEEMSVNFADYLEKLRMKEACRLLKEGVLVSDIAGKTGYNSVQSFRRAFKRAMGVSPSEYRAE